jgi:MFS family permease
VRWFERNLLGGVTFPGRGRLAAASVIDALGSGMLMPLTVLYFTVHVGLSVTSVGLGLTIGGVAALAFSPLGGVLIDALGPKPVLLAYWVMAAVAIAGYGLVAHWSEMVVVVTLAEVGSSASSTARKALVTGVARPEDSVRLMASQRALRNVGFGTGGLLAGAALAIGGVAYDGVVYGDAISFLVAVAVIARMPVAGRVRSGPRVRSTRGLRTVLADRRYLGLTALDFCSSFHATALEVALPLWVVFHTRAPRALTGLLFSLNTVIVVAAQVRATAGIRGLADLPRTYRRAATIMVFGAGAYLAAHYAGAAVAVVLLTVGLVLHTGTEMLASAGEWAVSIDFADRAHRGIYLSVFSVGSSLQDALGPTIVTSVLLLGAVWLWPVLVIVVCTGCLLTAAIVGRATPLELRSAARVGCGGAAPEMPR